MSFQKFSDLESFLTTYFAEAEAEQDAQTVTTFVTATSADKQGRVLSQAKSFLDTDSIVEDLGMAANRWFGDATEAREWLESIISLLSRATPTDGEVATKDSNGAALAEGDAVTVIKDLKVKGGSSDLKRGTLIKKIHLIGDPDNIECNVNGSTLVLKTMFLKKA